GQFLGRVHEGSRPRGIFAHRVYLQAESAINERPNQLMKPTASLRNNFSNGKGLTWPTPRMAKFILLSPRRLQQLVQEGIVPKCEARGRYNPVAVTQSYIRFLRDRVESPELSNDEFYAAKLAKLKAERASIELDLEIKRGSRIPLEDVAQ